MRTRNWSIRSKIIALASVPLVALLALWIFATVLTAGPAFNLLSAQTLLDSVGNPGEVLVGELQRERRLSVEYLSVSGVVPPVLTEQRAATDRAAADFRRAAGSDDAQSAAGDTLRARIRQIFTEIDNLRGNREHINQRKVDAVGAQGAYNSVIDAGFQMFHATATFNDERVDREIRGLTTVGRGQEYLSRVDSLLAGAGASGKFTADLRTEMLQDIGTARFLLQSGVNDMPAESRAAYEKLNSGTAFTQLSKMQDTLVADSRVGSVTPVPGTTWQPVYDTSAQQLRAFEINATASLTDRATPVAAAILIRLALAAVVGLLALIVSIVVSVKVGRSIVGRLRRLRGEALEMATERLPTVVRRLQRGEAVDVDVETPPLEYGKDEIGQLGHAFNDVQRTAVQSAVEEANVRRGINEVFLNIARRSQTLLHRQLALLDRMERRESEPQELEDLYRVDHLATRMRRHAEDLVILAGAAPGRGWRNPVPVIDVVRGAISEVEDYKRVDIRSVESSAVLGRAVGDVIHLLAELLENAASFSPPHTRVTVSGQVLPNGYAIEIEDRGLGMSPEAIEEANRRLLEPPDFDPADSARLGLFVVAQLANRHNIRVSLRPSAFAGVTAIVLVPGELVTGGAGPAALPADPSAAEKSWDRPLVGSGTDDPSRHSLAALQWQGTEELRQVTISGRPITINGSATQDDLRAGQHRAGIPNGGPAPSSVAEGLSADGLVQRRRVRRPVDLGSEPDVAEPTIPTQRRSIEGSRSGEVIGPVEEAGPAPRSVPRNSSPVMPTSAAPLFPSPTPPPVAPTSAAPMFAAPVSGPPGPVLPLDPGLLGTTEDGLPRRVRQANLAPQLRRPAGADDQQDTQPLRSPEQVRSIMSALQLGTTRGRIDASKYRTEPSPGEPAAADTGGQSTPPGERVTGGKVNGARPDGASFAEAATVSFPAIVNLAFAREQAASPNGRAAADPESADPASDDHVDGPEGNDVTRPEKDA
ncbi:nitrate- and nitrite sensing domain-containing protein [Micromonosporaceae bacterium Da 78-11]